MSKFCENCGTEMDDNQTVCPNCGNGAEVAQETETVTVEETTTETTTNTTTTSADKKDTIKKIGIIAGIAAAVVLLITIIVSIISGGYKSPIKNLVKGLNNSNAEVFLKAYPDFLKMDKSINDTTLKKEKAEDEIKYGDNVKYSVKFLKKEKINKDDLKKVVEYVEKKYEVKVKISAGYKVKVEQRTQGKDDYDYETVEYYVYKIDGKWKILDISPETAKKYL